MPRRPPRNWGRWAGLPHRHRPKKGRIELEYYGVDDLNDLLDALHALKTKINVSRETTERGQTMLDIKFIRENPDAVKENINKKFQNAKLPLVDEVIALDAERRAAINEGR